MSKNWSPNASTGDMYVTTSCLSMYIYQIWLCTLWLEATCWTTNTQVPSCSRAIQLSKEPSHGKLCLQVSMNKIRGYYPPTSSVSSTIHWTGSLSTQLHSPPLPYTTHYHCIITVSKQAISRIFAIFLICVPQSFFLKSEVMEEPSALGSTDTNSNCSKPTEALDTACVYT